MGSRRTSRTTVCPESRSAETTARERVGQVSAERHRGTRAYAAAARAARGGEHDDRVDDEDVDGQTGDGVEHGGPPRSRAVDVSNLGLPGRADPVDPLWRTCES